MKSLKGVLIFLVIVLVAIIAVGGATVGFNHSGHQMANSTQISKRTKTTQDNSGSNPSEQTTGQNRNNSSSNNVNNSNTNNSDQTGQVYQSAYGQYQQIPMGPGVQAQGQVSPEEYLKKMQEAMGIIKDATGLMANAPYMNSNETPGSNQQMNSASSGVGMDKIHEGIYKMAQGTTLMDQAMTGIQDEINKAKNNGTSFYNPSMVTPYANGALPVNPYTAPYLNQVNPNSNQQTQNSATNNSSSEQSNANMNNNQSATSQDTTQSSQSNSMNHNSNSMSGMNMGTGFSFSLQSVTYLIYGILILSLIGIIFGVIGFIANLFKPVQNEQKRGESVVG